MQGRTPLLCFYHLVAVLFPAGLLPASLRPTLTDARPRCVPRRRGIRLLSSIHCIPTSALTPAVFASAADTAVVSQHRSSSEPAGPRVHAGSVRTPRLPPPGRLRTWKGRTIDRQCQFYRTCNPNNSGDLNKRQGKVENKSVSC